MQLIGTLQQPPARAEAEAFFERFVLGGPARLAWFLDEIAAATGRRPQVSVDEAAKVADWVVQRLGDERPAERPEWFTDAYQSQTGWTAYGAALAEGFAFFIAEIYRRELGATWVLNTDEGHAYFYQPVMSERLASAPQRLISTLYRMQIGKESSEKVRSSLAFVIDQVRAEPEEGVARPDDAIGIGVDPLPDDPDFTHRVWIDENAELELGRDVFDALWERFETIPGVDRAIHEDREVFLVQAPGVATETLDTQVRAIVAAART